MRHIKLRRTRNRSSLGIKHQTRRQILLIQAIRQLTVAAQSRRQLQRGHLLPFRNSLIRNSSLKEGHTIHRNREGQRGRLFAIDIRHPIRQRIPFKSIPRILRRRTRNRPSRRIKRQTRRQLPIQAIRQRHIPTDRLRQL